MSKPFFEQFKYHVMYPEITKKVSKQPSLNTSVLYLGPNKTPEIIVTETYVSVNLLSDFRRNFKCEEFSVAEIIPYVKEKMVLSLVQSLENFSKYVLLNSKENLYKIVFKSIDGHLGIHFPHNMDLKNVIQYWSYYSNQEIVNFHYKNCNTLIFENIKYTNGDILEIVCTPKNREYNENIITALRYAFNLTSSDFNFLRNILCYYDRLKIKCKALTDVYLYENDFGYECHFKKEQE